MKKNRLITIFILLVILLKANFILAEERRYIGFNFFKSGAESVEIIGNFGKEKKVVNLPMLSISPKQWTLSLKLSPDFYYYRYIVDGKNEVPDPFIEDQVELSSGPLKGDFSLLKVFPKEFKDYIVMGNSFFREGKREWAVDVFFRMVKEFPAERDGYIKLAETYEALDRYGFAADAYLAALENDEEDYFIRREVALIYEKLYATTGKREFRKRANEEWIKLIEAGEYVQEAKEYLNRD